MEQVKISIVTIVKNSFDKIEHTMQSVLQQTFSDFEYIIKDGMSNDGTLDKISEIIEKYPQKNIQLISSMDKGIYDAMNQSVAYCNGKWVIFINSGDAFYSSVVLENVFMKDSEFCHAGVLYGDAIVRDDAEDMVWRADISLIKKKMPFCHQSCFIKRNILLRFPFDTKLKIAADYNNILDMYSNDIIFYLTGVIISIFELTGISTTNFVDKYKEKNEVISSHGYKSDRGVCFLTGLFIQYCKESIQRRVPESIHTRIRKMYKIYVKKYSHIPDCGVVRKGIHEDIIYY